MRGLGEEGEKERVFLVKKEVCVDYDSKIKRLDFPKWKRKDEGEGTSVSHRSALSLKTVSLCCLAPRN